MFATIFGRIPGCTTDLIGFYQLLVDQGRGASKPSRSVLAVAAESVAVKLRFLIKLVLSAPVAATKVKKKKKKKRKKNKK
jgi:hypothetical protein